MGQGHPEEPWAGDSVAETEATLALEAAGDFSRRNSLVFDDVGGWISGPSLDIERAGGRSAAAC
jgi:hypothetical protein